MDIQEIRDLVEDTTRHHGAPWKRVVSSDGSFYGVTDRNGAVVAGSPAVTALIAQAPTLIPELLDRLEQAEQAVVLANAECTRQKQQKGIFFRRATEAEQQIQRVREVMADWDTDEDAKGLHFDLERALDGATRRLADQGLGDNLARTTKNGENNA